MEEKTVYDYAVEFLKELEDRRIDYSVVNMSSHYEEGVPVIDIFAENDDSGYVTSFRLEDISIEEFEDSFYDVWLETFEDNFDEVIRF